jgi:hypothetical protein
MIACVMRPVNGVWPALIQHHPARTGRGRPCFMAPAPDSCARSQCRAVSVSVSGGS